MKALNTTKPNNQNPIWLRHKERGNFLLLQLMRRISLVFGRRLSRIVVYGIAIYFLLAVSTARRASGDYLSRVLERPVTWIDRYRHILAFATTIHDRFFLLNNQAALFDIKAFGAEGILKLQNRNQGALLLGAHMGSFEILLNHSRSNNFRTCMAMYPDNARQLNRALAAINPEAVAGIIALGQIGSMLTIHDKLQTGNLVGVLADRASGPDQYITLPFLGAPAHFPTGPFRLASMLGHPVFFMSGLYGGGNRYTLHFEQLVDFATVPRNQRDAAVQATLEKYVATLEQHCRAAPYNWFNFFDFWESAA